MTPAPAQKWDGYPNLRKRPPTPSKGRGSVQVRIRRAFIASGSDVLTIGLSRGNWANAAYCKFGDSMNAKTDRALLNSWHRGKNYSAIQ
jgi:hypothetical protein